MNEFEQKLQNLLRESEHQLDDESSHRLEQARRVALQARLDRHWLRIVLPVTGAAMAALLVAVLVLAPNTSPVDQSKNGIDSYSATDNLELYEDLDFYYWLAEEGLNG